MDKIRSIDLPELALTTATRLELLMQNPAISIPHADSTIEMLNAMGRKSMDEDELGHRDQESPLHVLGSLAMTILTQHLLELTCIEEPDTHERSVRKISLYPKSGNVNLLFERLDDVLVNAIIDHYMMCLRNGSSLPGGYLFESLRMDIDAAYGEVGELVPDKGSVS